LNKNDNTDFDDIMKNLNGYKTPKSGMLTPSLRKQKKERIFNLSTNISTSNFQNEAIFFGEGRKTSRNLITV